MPKNLRIKWRDFLNGANLITLIGIWLTAVVIVYRFNEYGNTLTAHLTFLAILTDLVDGYYARKYHCITRLGEILDRIRDKLLACFHFWFILCCYYQKTFSSFFIATFVCLFLVEISLAIAGTWGIKKKKTVNSNKWGKRKMFFECAGMVSWVIFNDLKPFGIQATDLIPASFILVFFVISFFLGGMSLKGYHEIYFPQEKQIA